VLSAPKVSFDKYGERLSRAANTRDVSVTKLRDRSDRFVLKFEKP